MLPAETLCSFDPSGYALAAPDQLPAAGVVPAAPLQRVSESYATTLDCLIGGSAWDFTAGGDVALMGRYGGFWPADRVQLPNHAPSGFFTELQFRAALSWSRWLCERNMLAKAFLNHVPAYV